MIDAISLETAHLLGDALPSAHRLRHRIFIERQRYAVPAYRGMEWDQFDTPAAVYMVWRDELTRVRAVARLIPTSQPYMIQQLWPELLPNGNMPSSDDLWEVSRFGIDRDLDREQRARVFGELFCAFGEFGLKTGISAYIFVTPAAVIDNALGNAGVDVQRLGGSNRLGRLPVVAGRSAVSFAALHRLRRHHGISGPVLRLVGEAETRAA
jgi:N-acyl-L-homoserine lactone synthetase